MSVLVVNYLAGPHLENCLRALLGQTMADFEVIVVDNGSSDGSLIPAMAAVAGDSRFVFDSPGRNVGFAVGNNRAAALSRGVWLATLNPDAFAAPDWLERLLEATARHPDTAMFGSTQRDAGDLGRLDGAGDNYFFAGVPWRGGFGWPALALPPEGEVFGPCAAAAFYRHDAFTAVGGFDESFFCYVEDVDLAFRLRLAGHRCIQVVGAEVRHVGGASSGSSTSDFARYHGLRNLVWCFVKNMPGPLFWSLLPFHVGGVALLVVKAALRGQGRTAFRAIWDALAQLPRIWARRRQVQAARRISSVAVARSLVWSPFSYLRRAPVVLANARSSRNRIYS